MPIYEYACLDCRKRVSVCFRTISEASDAAAVCPTCGVVFEHGRWHWKAKPASAQEHVCPACRRVKDDFPAGYVSLEGDFLREHRDELLHLVRNEEKRAKDEHPLERIMDIRQDGDKTVVTWAMYGKNGFMGKLVSLFINCDKMCGPQFEKGLVSLGEVAARTALAPAK